jgi:hypothetical protein
MDDLVADLTSTVQRLAKSRNHEVIRRLLSPGVGLRSHCRYQKLFLKIQALTNSVTQSYGSLLVGRVSHALIECYWEDKSKLGRMRRHLGFKRPCGKCQMCRFVNQQ